MIDTQTLDFFPRIDKTGREPPKPVDEPGPSVVPNDSLLFIAMVCYTEITDLRML